LGLGDGSRGGSYLSIVEVVGVVRVVVVVVAPPRHEVSFVAVVDEDPFWVTHTVKATATAITAANPSPMSLDVLLTDRPRAFGE
jgi:hypothetical protein